MVISELLPFGQNFHHNKPKMASPEQSIARVPPLRWYTGVVAIDHPLRPICVVLYNDRVLDGKVIETLVNWTKYAIERPVNETDTPAREVRASEVIATAQKYIPTVLDFDPADIYTYLVRLNESLRGLSVKNLLPKSGSGEQLPTESLLRQEPVEVSIKALNMKLVPFEGTVLPLKFL